MSLCNYTYQGITMNQQQLVERIMNELLEDTENKKYPKLKSILFKVETQSEIIEKLEKIKEFGKGKRRNPDKSSNNAGWIGVSEYMDLLHDLGKINAAGFSIASLLYPVYNEESRINKELIIRLSADQLLQDPDEKRSRKEIVEDITQLFAEERLNSKLGDIFHDIIGNIIIYGFGSTQVQDAISKGKRALNEKDKDSGKTLFEVIIANNPTLSEQLVLDIIVDRAKITANNIKAQHPGAKFFSEIDMATNKVVAPKAADGKPMILSGIHGRSDLVIVDSDGMVTVLDFKVANNKYQNWCAAKKYHTEYQLGFYRHILAANGLDGKNIKLVVQPIFTQRGDISNTEVEELVDLLDAARFKHNRLDWEYGEFTENIRKMINIPFSISPLEQPQFVTETNESLSDIITYQPKERTYNKEEFMDRFVHTETKNGKTYHVFYDWLENGKKYQAESEEEFTKEGGIIDQFNDKARKLTKSLILTIIKEVEAARVKKTRKSDLNFLESKNSNSEVSKHLTAAFGLYTSDQYELVDVPMLIDFGIIAYENKTTHTIYFEVLTDQFLSSKVDNNGLTTVLGNFYSNDEVRHLQGVDAMDANCGNMELIKAMHVINMLYEKFPDKFLNKKIGQIEVVNAVYGQRRTEDIETLKTNYGILASKIGINNHFSSDINTADVWEACMADLNKAIIDSQEDKDLKEILSNLKGTTQSKADRLELISEAIKKMKKRYDQLRFVDFKKERTFDLDNPIHVAYITLCETYNYLLGIPISYNGEISKWGLHFGEIIKILTIPFIKDQANTLNNGYPSKGLGTGTEMTSPQTVPSLTLRALFQYYDIAFINVREEYSKARAVINRITAPFIAKRESTMYKAMIGTKYSMWENLLVKDSEGKISEEMMLRNPYSDKTLSQEESDFLKAILWEINKYRLDLSPELKELNYLDNKELIESELLTNKKLIDAFLKSYFELPLRRASDFLRLKNIGRIGLTNYFVKKLKQGADEYDPRQLHSSRVAQLDSLKKDSCEMFNAYDIDTKQRTDLIKKEGVYDFETDLDYLVSDVAFQSIRQKYFEDVLLMSDTVATALHLVQLTTDRTHETEIEALDDEGKVIKGQTLIKSELKDVATGVGALKRFNSLMVLSFRPLQFIKELTFGQFTNYSRAWALKYSSNAISAKSVFNANKVIWGQTLGHYGDSFAGKGDLADFTMCEALNKVYGFANEDLNRTVENSTLQRNGLVQNGSRYMYIANSAPDFFNRLTLLIAKMMEDGCWEAHTLNEDGTLAYDFSKDKRFSELKVGSNGYIIKPTSLKGLEQLGLYRAMAEDFEREGKEKFINVVNGQEVFKPFKRAYTVNQRNSIKEVADLAYGFYDHEAKSLIDHKFVGLIWKQFMTFWTAKVQLWFRGRPLSPGDNTSQGRFVQRTENGEKLWRRIKEEANGTIAVYEVKDSELLPEEVGKLEPCYGWQGDYSEGLVYSIMGMFYDIFHADFKHLRNDKLQLGNLKLALHDLLIGMLLFYLLRFIFSGGTDKMQDVKPTERILLRAMQDVGPQSITSLNWEPGFYTTLVNTKNDMFKMLTKDDHDLADMLEKRIGAIKDFTWDEESES